MKDILELVYELNGIIITAKNFSEIERKLKEVLSKRIPVEWMEMWIVKEDRVQVYGKDKYIPLQETPIECLIKTTSCFYRKDISEEQKFQIERQFYEKGLRSIIYVPLLYEKKVFAVWVVASSKPNIYTEKDKEILKLIASQISAPLKIFILYEEKNRELELLKTVNRLTEIVLSDVEINSVFKKFSEELKKYIPFERLSIGIVEGENIKYAAVSEVIKTGRFEGTSIPLKYATSQWVIKNKKTLIRKDLLKEKEFPLEERKVRQGIRSTLHVPLIYKGKVFGTINLSSTKPNAYGEWEKLVLETLVSQISSIIAISCIYSPLYNHLTEVYNRRYFDEKIDEEIKYRERYGGEFCVCLCDLDNFKRYNDSYGHMEGDNCLREVATIMKESIRKTDLVFRYGGDEFAIIMPNTSLEEAIGVAERLKDAIKEKMEDKGITMSIGIASYPIDGKTRTEVIDKADRRLLKAKETKNLIVYKD
ncbi:MAG: GAF domain-containing protein [Thermodesulfobacterium sp.]|uniref:diguanylate cyclase n=1 Tax=Candidatus Thermodesulfobacterium syntrophicum TaxID=3060442 RepID=A0AAE3NYM7_9BACT|nr:GAF domain-containing protein [Candidatus Thermodesulfobacterium syntrophicum]